MYSSKKKADLTSRELEVLRLLADGHSQPTIAKKLFISPDTSKLRVKNLREKLDAATAAQAVYRAMKEKILD